MPMFLHLSMTAQLGLLGHPNIVGKILRLHFLSHSSNNLCVIKSTTHARWTERSGILSGSPGVMGLHFHCHYEFQILR